MSTGVSFGEIAVILLLIIIFVKPKDLPDLLRKTMKTAGEIRAKSKALIDEISKM